MARKRSRGGESSPKKQKLERRREKLKAWREKKKRETKTKLTLSTTQSSKPSIFDTIKEKKIEVKDDEKKSNTVEKDQVDPLEAYMKTIEKVPDRSSSGTISMDEILALSTASSRTSDVSADVFKKHLMRHIEQPTSDETSKSLSRDEPTLTPLQLLEEKMKRRTLHKVNHEEEDYITFRKKFYTPHSEITSMESNDVEEFRRKLRVRIRGKRCPRPILHWYQTGLSTKLMFTLKRKKYKEPFPIQQQALPAIMSGRDVIAVAKTGSGKTLAFLLPMFRQILDQPRLREGEGPIGLICAPARELAVQIHNECKSFAKKLGLRAVAVYGGAPMADQISDLRRGADVVTCTPGRFIDLLSMNSGRLLSLKRVTYFVLDEADRMFDMGFEPQIAMIMQNIRPESQTVMFSATFPSHVERLARKLLKHEPLEIVIGGRAAVSDTIDQYVEVRDANTKFPRLLQLLGLWNDKGSILIFVDTQLLCDSLFTKLMRAGYYALSLHGGKDQADRDQTLTDFKTGVRTVMVATSVAGRGLDVKDLALVINYVVPNHLEDYIHRVGRTGRAGRKGTAYTFIEPSEEQYSPDLVKALMDSACEVPEDLKKMSVEFMKKVKSGKAKKRGSGFTRKCKGFKFDENETKERILEEELKKLQAKVSAGKAEMSELMEVQNELKRIQGTKEQQKMERQATAAAKTVKSDSDNNNNNNKITNAADLAKRLSMQIMGAQQQQQPKIGGTGTIDRLNAYVETIDINPYPLRARQIVNRKSVTDGIMESTGAVVMCKGMYIQPGRPVPQGVQPLHLAVTGRTPIVVKRAVAELMRLLNEATQEELNKRQPVGKYSVV